MEEIITKWYPFGSCPRQICDPKRITCRFEKEFFEIMNSYNCRKKKIYYSIYSCDEAGDFHDVKIDLIFFDLDSERSQENLQKMYEYCVKENLRCMLLFSTGGFWMYIYTIPQILTNPKIALANAQIAIADKLGMTIGNSKEADIDGSSIGDISRITRAINCKDLERDRYCIVLRNTEIYWPYEKICELAKKQRFEYYYYGENLLDLSKYDSNVPMFNKSHYSMMKSEYDESSASIKDNEYLIDVDTFLPCVRSWLESGNDIWIARYYFAVYCYVTAISAKTCDSIAQKYFSQTKRTDSFINNYVHFKKHGILKQAYSNKIFPNCDTLIQKGLCNSKCDKYCENDSPVYQI